MYLTQKRVLCAYTTNTILKVTNVYQTVRIAPKMTRAPKIAAQKKQPISILRDKKYLYQTALMLLNPGIVHKIMQQL